MLQQSYGRFGGAERLFFSHYDQLKRMDKDVTAFYSGSILEGCRSRLDPEEVYRIPCGIPRNHRDFNSLMRFVSALGDFDRILIHHHLEPMLALYVTKLFGKKTIWYSGSLFELPWERVITRIDYRRLSPTLKQTAAEFYGRAVSGFLLSNRLYNTVREVAKVVDIETVRKYGTILANSLFLSELLARVFKLKNAPEVVYPGVDPAFELLSRGPQPAEEDYVLDVGSLLPLKNFEAVIRAAATISSAKIVVVGQGPEMRRLKDIATQLGVRIEFRGNLETETELASDYSRCKLLTLMSLYETFGLTPIEAGLFLKPSIVTDQGGPPEVVIDGVSGFVVNPKNYRLIAEKMRLLLENESLRHEMGKRARENVLEKFTLEKSTSRLLEAIET